MNKKGTLDWMVIHHKIKGTLSGPEEKELQEWMQKDTRRKKFVESAEKHDLSETFPPVGREQEDRAWARFRLSRRKAGRVVYKRILQWGVAAVFFIACGTGLWFFQTVGYFGSEQVARTVILPGSSKACLVLSDGKMIDLDRAGNRQLTDQQATICLDSTGITYEKRSGQGKEVFNTLRIPQGGEYSLTLSDGTRVWLNSKTELTYPVSFTGKERRVRLNGEAYFEVARNEALPFIVETDKMGVRVLGTSFNVNAYLDEPEIVTTLVSGRVQIEGTEGTERVLCPTEQAAWDRKAGIVRVRKVNTLPFIQWREGKFVFRDNNLESIMRTLARWYDLDYEFEQPELKAEKFYGMMSRYADVSELLEQFEKTGKVHFAFEGKKVVVRK